MLNILKKLRFLALIIAIGLSSNLSYAAETGESDVNVKSNEVLVKIKGLYCTSCAYGVRKKLSKLDFVNQDKFKKGIFINIDAQTATIAIKSDAKSNIDTVFKTVKKAGFEPLIAYELDSNGQLLTHNAQ